MKWMEEIRRNTKMCCINKAVGVKENNNNEETTNILPEEENDKLEIVHDVINKTKVTMDNNNKDTMTNKFLEDKNMVIDILENEVKTSCINADVLQYYNGIIDVNGNGSCAYYCIQHGLRQQSKLYETDMNKSRKAFTTSLC